MDCLLGCSIHRKLIRFYRNLSHLANYKADRGNCSLVDLVHSQMHVGYSIARGDGLSRQCY